MAVANEVWMLENSVYSILSPEGFASILWKDSKKADMAAEVMKMTARDLKELKIVDQVIPEGLPACQEEVPKIAEEMEMRLVHFLKEYGTMTGEELAAHRYERFRRF